MKVKLVKLQNKIQRLSNILHVKHQTRQPEQLVTKFKDCTIMLIFKSGKFRIMGAADELDLLFNIYSITILFESFPPVIIQTMTGTFQFPTHINLYKLADCCKSLYLPEIFPAVRIQTYLPISVNVFSSGKVTICGLKDIDVATKIKEDLLTCCNDFHLQHP